MAMGDAADRLAVEDLPVGSGQRGRVSDGELLLPVAELRVVLLDLDVLRLQAFHDIVHHRGRGGHADGGEAERLVERGVGAVRVLDGEGELALEGGAHGEARFGAGGDLALEEGAWARLPRRSLERAHVDDHGRGVRGVGQHGEGLRIGHKTDLAHGPHALHGGELVEHVHSLHGHGEADPVHHPRGEALHVGRLATGDAAVVRVQEAHQAHAGAPRPVECAASEQPRAAAVSSWRPALLRREAHEISMGRLYGAGREGFPLLPRSANRGFPRDASERNRTNRHVRASARGTRRTYRRLKGRATFIAEPAITAVEAVMAMLHRREAYHASAPTGRLPFLDSPRLHQVGGGRAQEDLRGIGESPSWARAVREAMGGPARSAQLRTTSPCRRWSSAAAWASSVYFSRVAAASSGGKAPLSTSERNSPSMRGKCRSCPTSSSRGTRSSHAAPASTTASPGCASCQLVTARASVARTREPSPAGITERRRRKPVSASCSTRISARVPRMSERWRSPPPGGSVSSQRVSRAAVTSPTRKVSSALLR